MFTKPAVAVPRLLSEERRGAAMRTIRESINLANIRDIRDNYFLRANTRPANNNSSNSSTGSSEESSGPGFSVCGVCRVCTCLSLDFVKTPIGIMKLAELVLCLVIQNILTKHGPEYADKLGRGLSILGAANSACLVTTLVLLLCYSLSSHTYNRVRPSLFI